MSDGFIPVKSKKSRHQRKFQAKPQPQPQFEDDGWGAWNIKADNSAWFKPKSYFGEYKAWDQQERVDRLKDFVPFWRDNVLAAERGEEMKKYADFLDRLYEEEDEWGTGVEANPWGVPDQGQCDDGWGKIDDGGWGTADNSGWKIHEVGKPSGGEVVTNEGIVNDDGWGPKDWEDSYDPWAPGKDTCDEWARAFEGKVDRKSSETAKNCSVEESAEKDEKGSSFITKVARRQGASGLRKKRMENFYSMPTPQKVQKIEEMVDFLRKST